MKYLLLVICLALSIPVSANEPAHCEANRVKFNQLWNEKQFEAAAALMELQLTDLKCEKKDFDQASTALAYIKAAGFLASTYSHAMETTIQEGGLFTKLFAQE